eukprot:15430942-Alexandrium_andersonii.AAC.1
MGLPPQGPRWRQRGELEGERETPLAAEYPPALCTAILRGIAAQHAREGRALAEHVVRRLDQGRAATSSEAERPSMLGRA